MKRIAKNFVRNESGASLVEYVLLCVLIGVVAILGDSSAKGFASHRNISTGCP